MSLNLTNLFRKTIEKEKLGSENLHTPIYKTGLDILDYRNGRYENESLVTGIDGGKILTIIGKAGTGKSTLGIQVAINIVNNYDHSQVIHLDFERATNISRIQGLSGWNQDKIRDKYILMNRDITSESLYTLIKSIADIKLNKDNYDTLKIDTGKKDYDGNTVYTLPPTVVLVDSWAVMVPKDIEQEETLSGSMSASSIAKANNAIIKRISGTLESANIMLIIINHITQKIEIGPVKTQAQLNYLKQDESIPGGTSCIYMANSLLKLTPSTKLDDSEGLGVKGFMIKAEFIKSRSNEAGRPFEMVFSQTNGYSNILTNYNILKSAGYLKGSPRAYYLETCPDVKFTQKKFLEKYNEHPELREEVARLVKDVLVNYVPRPDALENSELELVKCVDEQNDVWEGSDGKYYLSTGEEVEYIVE